MKKKIEELTWIEVEHLVALLEGDLKPNSFSNVRYIKPYTRDWSLIGPILEREHYEVEFHFGKWLCETEGGAGIGYKTLPEAIARCYVADKLGSIVEVEDEGQ